MSHVIAKPASRQSQLIAGNSSISRFVQRNNRSRSPPRNHSNSLCNEKITTRKLSFRHGLPVSGSEDAFGNFMSPGFWQSVDEAEESGLWRKNVCNFRLMRNYLEYLGIRKCNR
jgi:hypothetical protein